MPPSWFLTLEFIFWFAPDILQLFFLGPELQYPGWSPITHCQPTCQPALLMTCFQTPWGCAELAYWGHPARSLTDLPDAEFLPRLLRALALCSISLLKQTPLPMLSHPLTLFLLLRKAPFGLSHVSGPISSPDQEPLKFRPRPHQSLDFGYSLAGHSSI